MNGRKSSGFTLIELLIVIAIICILAAILFPVFQSAREKARQTSCASNMSQIGKALSMYAQDNDSLMPGVVGFGTVTAPGLGSLSTIYYCQFSAIPSPSWSSLDGSTQGGAGAAAAQIAGVGWAGALLAYTKSSGVFTCPDDTTALKRPGLTAVSYGLNSNIAMAKTGWFVSPSRTVAVFETSGSQVDLSNPSEGTTNAAGVPYQVAPPSGYLSPAGEGIYLPGVCTGFSTATLLTIATTKINWTTFNGKLNDGTVVYKTGLFARYGTQMPATGTAAAGVFTSATGVHSNGANYLALDGHVSWRTPNRVSTGSTISADPGLGTQYSESAIGASSTCKNWPPAAGTGVTGYDLTFSFV